MTRLRMLSTTSAAAFRTCRRLYHFTRNLGYEPARKDAALRFGTLKHRGLEAWFVAALWGATQEEQLAFALKALRDFPEADPYERAKAEALMLGYHMVWKDAPLQVAGVEVSFEVPLVHPVYRREHPFYGFLGRIDALAYVAGELCVIEHKTTTSLIDTGSRYWSKLLMDAQVSDYLAAATEATAVIYDVIHKPKLEPLEAESPTLKKARKRWESSRTGPETPEEYGLRITEEIAEAPAKFYQRRKVVRLQSEARAAMIDLWDTANEMTFAHITDTWSRNTQACDNQYGRPCVFLPVCSGTARLDDETRYKKTERE